MTEGQEPTTGKPASSTVKDFAVVLVPVVATYVLTQLKVPLWGIGIGALVAVVVAAIVFVKPVQRLPWRAWRFLVSIRITTTKRMEYRTQEMGRMKLEVLQFAKAQHDKLVDTQERRIAALKEDNAEDVKEYERQVATLENERDNAVKNAELFQAEAESMKRESVDLKVRLTDLVGIEAQIRDLRTELLAAKNRAGVAEDALKKELAQTAALKDVAATHQSHLAEAFDKARTWEVRAKKAEELLASKTRADQKRDAITGPRPDPSQGPHLQEQRLGRGIAALLMPGAQAEDDDGYVPEPNWRIAQDGEDDTLWRIGSTIEESRARRVRMAASRKMFDITKGGYWREIRGGFGGHEKAFEGKLDDWAIENGITFRVTWFPPDSDDERHEDVPGIIDYSHYRVEF